MSDLGGMTEKVTIELDGLGTSPPMGPSDRGPRSEVRVFASVHRQRHSYPKLLAVTPGATCKLSIGGQRRVQHARTAPPTMKWGSGNLPNHPLSTYLSNLSVETEDCLHWGFLKSERITPTGDVGWCVKTVRKGGRRKGRQKESRSFKYSSISERNSD